LPRGVVLREPLHLVYVAQANGEPIVCHPRTLVICEDNSQTTIVQSYLGLDEGVTFTNAVTEIIADVVAPLLVGHAVADIPTTWHRHYDLMRVRGHWSGFFTDALAAIASARASDTPRTNAISWT
jgi:hypothetical protein